MKIYLTVRLSLEHISSEVNMTKEKILVVEDDEDLSFIVCTQLSENGYDADATYTCREAKKKLQEEKYDLILLDMLLPDSTGVELCKDIRQRVLCPIIFMSCMDERSIVVEALQMGADDYIVKPVDYSELLARIKVNLRRINEYSKNKKGGCITLAQCEIDKSTHVVWKTKENERYEAIPLSPIEYKLLLMFVEHPDQLLLYEELYRCIWESDDLGDVRTVMVHVSNLRKKMDYIETEIIHTVRGAGYIFNQT